MPPRNENTLITSSIYDDAGNQTEVIDPMAVKTCRVFDDAGRLRKTIENCVPGGGGGNSSSGQCVDKNRTTRFGYNLENRMTSLLLENASTGNQETVWAYSVTATTVGTVTTGINSNSLLASKTYPDNGVETYQFFSKSANIGNDVNFHTLQQIMEATGIEVRLSGKMIHTKLILVDGHRCLLGSANFSIFSLQKAGELCVLLEDDAFTPSLMEVLGERWYLGIPVEDSSKLPRYSRMLARLQQWHQRNSSHA